MSYVLLVVGLLPFPSNSYVLQVVTQLMSDLLTPISSGIGKGFHILLTFCAGTIHFSSKDISFVLCDTLSGFCTFLST